jgi:tetratricopeptide (TPR) repeat protein
VPAFALGALLAAVLGALLAAGPAFAADRGAAHAAFDRGMRLYEDGDYEGAVEAFREVAEMGVLDPALEYDLGNAWFKAGRLGHAVYHYRRAHALAPRDEDVKANLEYARFLALDRIEETGATTDRRVEGWLDRVTPSEAARVPMALWIAAGLVGCVWQLGRAEGRPGRRSFVVLSALWALSFAGAWAVERRAARLNEAVVLAREAVVRNGPGDSFETAFVLHEGAEAVVEGERGAWTEISLPGDLRGWISADQIARL